MVITVDSNNGISCGQPCREMRQAPLMPNDDFRLTKLGSSPKNIKHVKQVKTVETFLIFETSPMELVG